MLIFVLLLIGVAAVLGFYAQANQAGHDVTLFGNTWHTYAWVPAAIAAGAVALVCLSAMAFAIWRIRSLRRSNTALRNDINLYKLEHAGMTAPAAPRPVVAEREIVGRQAARPERTERAVEPDLEAAGRPRNEAEHLQTFPVEAGSSR